MALRFDFPFLALPPRELGKAASMALVSGMLCKALSPMEARSTAEKEPFCWIYPLSSCISTYWNFCSCFLSWDLLCVTICSSSDCRLISLFLLI